MYNTLIKYYVEQCNLVTFELDNLLIVLAFSTNLDPY
jgi:hypothetical protein